MKYPVSHTERIEEIEPIVSSWPVEKSFDHVLKWLMQFDTPDIELGARVIRNLNVVGFEDLNTSLSIAYSKLERVAIDKGSKISSRNTLFAGIGDGAKSGAMIGYNFRITNELPEENFMTDDSIGHLERGAVENIVLVDDIVGTGQQASREIKSLTEKVTPFGVKNIFLLTAVGMTAGIKRIIDETKAHVFSAFEYSEADTASNLDSMFYDGIPHENRARFRDRLAYYGQVSSESGLGFGGVGALIAFYYNTPNISLPVIWGSRNSWIPLFKRAIKINGIGAYYKQFDASISKRKRDNAPIAKPDRELLLFVEGRLDEAFFEYVTSAIGDTGFRKITVISLGGHGSKTLIDNIAKLSKHLLFVIEEDPHAPASYVERFRRYIGENPSVTVPPIESLLDFDRLANDERWGKYLPKPDNLGEVRSQFFIRRGFSDIHRRLSTQGYSLRNFFEEFSDPEKVRKLRAQLKDRIREMATGDVSKDV